MVCQAPKCFRPKVGRCMYPNPWILYTIEQSGKGKSRSEIREGYHRPGGWKDRNFGDRTGPGPSDKNYRRRVMCAGQTTDETRAATVLQARRRGHLARRQAARKRSDRSDERWAATIVQATGRGHLARRVVKERRRREAARKLSDARKLSAAKKRALQILYPAREAEAAKKRTNERRAATVLQARRRGHLARRVVVERRRRTREAEARKLSAAKKRALQILYPAREAVAAKQRSNDRIKAQARRVQFKEPSPRRQATRKSTRQRKLPAKLRS